MSLEYVEAIIDEKVVKIAKLTHESVDYALQQIILSADENKVRYNKNLISLVRLSIWNDLYASSLEYIDPYLVYTFTPLINDAVTEIMDSTTNQFLIDLCHEFINEKTIGV